MLSTSSDWRENGIMKELRTPTPTEAPQINFARGIKQVDLDPEFGNVKRGKVRDKWEFGIDANGQLMLIDEVATPDSSRFWLAKTYQEKFAKGEDPEAFDKEALRKSLQANGFTGDGPIPIVDPFVIDRMSETYRLPYKMITGTDLPQVAEPKVLQTEIKQVMKDYLAA